tara:strand:+ start:637 stop:762 length:126 start_codon:yes stop_codon:yes gene_type:complete
MTREDTFPRELSKRKNSQMQRTIVRKVGVSVQVVGRVQKQK